MKEFFNAYKNYIIKHPRVAEYKITSEKFDAYKLSEVKNLVKTDIPCTDNDAKAIDQFVRFSEYLHEIFVKLGIFS